MSLELWSHSQRKTHNASPLTDSLDARRRQMVEVEREPVTAARLPDGRVVMIRPLEETDRTALLAFGRALPHTDHLLLEDDFTSSDTVARLINARFAENWRQLVASVDDQIVGYSVVRRLPG